MQSFEMFFFLSNNYLTRHTVIHRGVEPHHCRFYEKAFASKSELTKHMKIQKGEKPHQCSYCDKAFDKKI